MKMKLLGLIACRALLGLTVAANASPYVVTLEEVGSNVVATGNGSIDKTGLVFHNTAGGSPGVEPNAAEINTGPNNSNNLDYYTATLSGPTSFGPGSTVPGSAGLTTTTI